jgi:hypothetical protein
VADLQRINRVLVSVSKITFSEQSVLSGRPLESCFHNHRRNRYYKNNPNHGSKDRTKDQHHDKNRDRNHRKRYAGKEKLKTLPETGSRDGAYNSGSWPSRYDDLETTTHSVPYIIGNQLASGR